MSASTKTLGSDVLYRSALELLRSRRRQPGPGYKAPALTGKPACDGMRMWLNQIGHSDSVIDQLRIIHVAGTKGKGSTCAFAEAFLEARRRRTGFPEKHALYTSPALHEETERIRVNSDQISKEDFANNVFEVWNSLQEENQKDGFLPKFLQLMLLVGIHTFIRKGVKIAIIETHHGGQFDSTNIFQRPAATGVTSLGFDHVAELGPTIADIAWHKAGIFKQGCPAFTFFDQPEAAKKVLNDRAKDAKVELQIIQSDPRLPSDHIAIRPEVQRMNCSFAKALVDCYLEQDAPGALRHLNDVDIMSGLDNVHLLGRFQYLDRGRIGWYLDGAHNAMSIDNPVRWFSSETKGSLQARLETIRTPRLHHTSARILAFSHISIERDGEEVLQALIDSVRRRKVEFDHVIFCYDGLREDGSMKEDTNFGVQGARSRYDHIWEASSLPGRVTNTTTISETIQLIEDISAMYGHSDVLVTGSFHLVGGILPQIRGL